ncbi:glpG protein [Spirochaetia bacterium]|nr:glpG protein [Spirochaetia bacterium]
MNPLRRPFRYQYDNAVIYLIIINVGIFALQYLLFPWLKYFLALTPLAVFRGWIWQFVTYMFAHDGIRHILFNMLALFIFGTQVERHMGSREFLLYYFITGTLSGAFSFLLYWYISPGVPLLGASGAIFAVELAYAAFFPDSVVYIWGILPLRAPLMVMGFTALELVSSVAGRSTGVAHLTHLAGFAFGWLYFLVRFRINPWKSLFHR